jgi:alkanesulfonate monooxygenase SsuD/methylene tetrahydromethanopterin reductase-like flavin-dependent oxidoreductase (luciferase family)
MAGSGSATLLCEQARLAEAWGYDSFWLPENHFSGAAAIPEPMMLLAAVAATTSTLRLGTTSFLLPIRHPLQAAAQIAVLDRLSEGRIIVGLGRGFQPAMLAAYGVEAAEKRRLFRESLAIMIAAWRGDPIGEGESVVHLAPLPVQTPHPPLWLAAFGPKAIRQAGMLGLPYLASPVEPIQKLTQNFERHREALEESGHAAPRERVIMRSVFVSDDPARCDTVRRRMRDSPLPTVVEGSQELDDWALVGSQSQVREGIERYRETLGITHLLGSRLRIGGIDDAWLRESTEALPGSL